MKWQHDSIRTNQSLLSKSVFYNLIYWCHLPTPMNRCYVGPHWCAIMTGRNPLQMTEFLKLLSVAGEITNIMKKMSRRMYPNAHFSVLVLWQKYFIASSSTDVGMRCKNKPRTHNFLWFCSSPLLLCASKKREHFGVNSYSHSLPKINEFFTIPRVLFMVIFKQVRTAILLALMSFFLLFFPCSAATFKPRVLWGHAKVEANDLQLLPLATLILHSHLFKNTEEQKEITERQATCWGGDWKCAWDQWRHYRRWGRAAPAPVAPGNTCGVQEQPSPSVLMAPVRPPTASCQTKQPSLNSCIKIISWSCSGGRTLCLLA